MGVLPLLSTNTVSTPTPARRSPVATRPTQAVARPAVAKPEPPKTRRGEPAPSADQPLIVPTDPKARYFILEKGGTQRRPTLVTKRIGPSGTSFSKKEFDCSTGTFRYLGDGDTLEEMRRSAPEPSMAPLVEGSISYYHWRHACRA